jgi:Alpha amylase, C-terminal all-beta domain
MSRILTGLLAVVLGAVVVSATAGGAINHPVPGIYGRITAGPTCPVERPGQQCAPRPVVATVDVQRRHRTVASTRSNSAGDYAVGVPRAGTYTVVIDTGAMFPRCPTKTVTVSKSQSVRVDMLCDTGIR